MPQWNSEWMKFTREIWLYSLSENKAFPLINGACIVVSTWRIAKSYQLLYL